MISDAESVAFPQVANRCRLKYKNYGKDKILLAYEMITKLWDDIQALCTFKAGEDWDDYVAGDTRYTILI